MTLIVVALKDEAIPLIEYLKLQHIPEITKFKVYKKDEIILIISGLGKIKSAIATTFIITKFPNPNAIINFGICGCGDLNIDIGELLLAKKIVDIATEKTYLSDINFTHNLREITIHTFDKPVENQAIGIVGAEMEASGFFEASLRFLKANKIFSIKIVSDHLNTKGVDKFFILELIRKHSNKISDFIEILQTKRS